MEAKELMIGDWVSHFDEGKNCVVTELRGRKVSVSFTDSNGKKKYSELLPEMAFEPIPLTEEILEKNFTAMPNTFWSSVDYFYYNSSHTVKICCYIVDGTWKITYGEDTIGGKPEWNMYVTYVHELQHALRLCGIEKEIEI